MSAAAAKPKAAKKAAEHPTCKAMVTAAIVALKNRNGSSRQAIQKYIEANYKGLSNVTMHLRNAIKSMVEKGDLNRTKGTGVAGTFKVVPKKVEKPKKKKVVKKKPAKKVAKKTSQEGRQKTSCQEGRQETCCQETSCQKSCQTRCQESCPQEEACFS